MSELLKFSEKISAVALPFEYSPYIGPSFASLVHVFYALCVTYNSVSFN